MAGHVFVMHETMIELCDFEANVDKTDNQIAFVKKILVFLIETTNLYNGRSPKRAVRHHVGIAEAARIVQVRRRHLPADVGVTESVYGTEGPLVSFTGVIMEETARDRHFGIVKRWHDVIEPFGLGH